MPTLYAKRLKLKAKSGSLLVIAIIFLFVVLIFSMATFTGVANFVRFGSNASMREQAVNLTEAGIDYALWKFNTDGSYGGSGGPTIPLGPGQIEISVSTPLPSGNIKIVSTGYIPAYGPSLKIKTKAQVEIAQQSSSTSFPYAILAGEQGPCSDPEDGPTCNTGRLRLDECVEILGNCSNSGPPITRINGDVFSNKSIGQNICRSNSRCQIYGSTYALEGIHDNIYVDGDEFPNFNPAEPHPPIDDNFWEAAAANPAIGGGVTDCSVTPSACDLESGTHNIGPRKYIGSLRIDSSANVTIKGPIYVTGLLTISGGGITVKLDDSFASKSTVILSDNRCGISGAQLLGTNSSPRGYLLFSCGGSAGVNQVTIGSPSEAIFYAIRQPLAIAGGTFTNPPVELTGAVIAKDLDFGPLLMLTYDQNLKNNLSLAECPTCSGPTPSPSSGWQLVRGTYKFTK